MMKFVILRVAQVDEDRLKKTVLVEWDEEKIFEKLLHNFSKYAVRADEEPLRLAWVQTIKEFKQETLTIP
jgi:hypothetical protein